MSFPSPVWSFFGPKNRIWSRKCRRSPVLRGWRLESGGLLCLEAAAIEPAAGCPPPPYSAGTTKSLMTAMCCMLVAPLSVDSAGEMSESGEYTRVSTTRPALKELEPMTVDVW